MHRVAKQTLWLVLVCLGLLATTILVAAPAEAAPSYRVTRVSDGDTIKVVVRGKVERVRLIGIDTPELGHGGVKDQCYARAARSEMQELVRGKRVRLVRDATQADRDRYGRLLRYVHTATGNKDVGKTLIAKGAGRQYSYDKRYRHRSAYLATERRAQKARRGLWRACAAGSTSPDVPVAPPAPLVAPAPGSCVIKGNIANDGEKIYHVPGQSHYGVTIIDTSKGERWFCTEAEAVAAGWRRSQN